MSETTEAKGKAARKGQGGGTPRPRKPKPPLFINHREIARDSGVTTKGIRKRIDKGTFPLPHSSQGDDLLWLRADYDHYVRTGLWPSHMKMAPKVS